MNLGRILLLLLCLHPALSSAAPRVVTSIAPLQELTAAIMHGLGEPETIIEHQASAHHFSFKPSHLRRLLNAELVIWIDRRFESGFSRVPEILPAASRQLELLPALGLQTSDGHIWYSASLLQQSIGLVAAALAELDPLNQARYRKNADNLREAVAAWSERMQRRWRDSSPRLLTDHVFLEHFSTDMPMFEIASIQDEHASAGSLKDLERLERWLQEKPAACVLSLESAGALTRSLAARYDLRIINISGQAGDSIMQRLQRLEDALDTCFEAG